MKKLLFVGCLVASAVPLVACSGASTPEDGTFGATAVESAEEASAEEEIVQRESFKTLDGGDVEITLDADGGITVSILEPGMSKQVFADRAAGRADLVDLYLQLTGEADVPDGILEINRHYVAAQARFQARQAEATGGEELELVQGAADDIARPAAGGLSLDQLDLSESEFIDSYCDADRWDYLHCWPGITGTAYITGTVFSLTTDAYAYRGSIYHRIQNKKALGSWKTRHSNTVPAGYLSQLERVSDGLFGNMRGGVWEADGDGYHLSIYGLN